VTKDLCKSYNIKATHSQIVGFLCAMLFIMGLPYCTRGGNTLLDVTDHFVGAYFLLFSCFVESIAFSLDFGWERFASIILQSTKGNASTPTGRQVYPEWFWKVRVCYIIPIATFGLLMSAFVHDAFIEKYGDGDYSSGAVAVGWIVFALLVCISCATLADKGSSTLPPFPNNSEDENWSEKHGGRNENSTL
jgi:hypothetical protein